VLKYGLPVPAGTSGKLAPHGKENFLFYFKHRQNLHAVYADGIDLPIGVGLLMPPEGRQEIGGLAGLGGGQVLQPLAVLPGEDKVVEMAGPVLGAVPDHRAFVVLQQKSIRERIPIIAAKII
jgi:hypothetical protein